MTKLDCNWRGYWVAAPTPFTSEGQIDEASFRELIRMYIRDGAHGFLINGTTGEWFSQSDAERRRVAEIAVSETKGHIPVVIGCTSFTAEAVAEFGRHAKTIGADGILFTPPPYVRPYVKEIVQFYRDVEARAGMPMIVYNWPWGTNVDMDRSTLSELANLDCVVAVKDSTPNRAQFFDTLEVLAGRVRVFGAGLMTRIGISVMRDVGGDGYIGGGAILGRDHSAFFEAAWAGDTARAATLAERHNQSVRLLAHPSWPGAQQAQLKAAMGMLGQPAGVPKAPRLPIEDPVELARIRRALEVLELIRPTEKQKALSARSSAVPVH